MRIFFFVFFCFFISVESDGVGIRSMLVAFATCFDLKYCYLSQRFLSCGIFLFFGFCRWCWKVVVSLLSCGKGICCICSLFFHIERLFVAKVLIKRSFFVFLFFVINVEKWLYFCSNGWEVCLLYLFSVLMWKYLFFLISILYAIVFLFFGFLSLVMKVMVFVL